MNTNNSQISTPEPEGSLTQASFGTLPIFAGAPKPRITLAPQTLQELAAARAQIISGSSVKIEVSGEALKFL